QRDRGRLAGGLGEGVAVLVDVERELHLVLRRLVVGGAGRALALLRHVHAGELRPHGRDEEERDAAGEQVDEGDEVDRRVERLLPTFPRRSWCCATHGGSPW